MKENIVRFDEFFINLTKTENMPVEAKGKIANPNNLPFLQAQILQKIYFDLFEQEQTTIEDLSKLTKGGSQLAPPTLFVPVVTESHVGCGDGTSYH